MQDFFHSTASVLQGLRHETSSIRDPGWGFLRFPWCRGQLEEALKDAEHQRRRSELLGCPRPVAVGKSLGDRVLVVVVRRGGEGVRRVGQRGYLARRVGAKFSFG